MNTLRNNLVHLGQTYWDHAQKVSGRTATLPEIQIAAFGKYEGCYQFVEDRYYPTGRVVYRPEEILGEYFPDEHKVVINLDWIDVLPMPYILHALLPHELAHAFEMATRKNYSLILDDEPHGRRWKKVCKFFAISEPAAHELSWKELSTLFSVQPEGDLPDIEPKPVEVDLDETFTWSKVGQEFMDDYGDRISQVTFGRLFHWPTRSYIYSPMYYGD
jgi:hypothetical protein